MKEIETKTENRNEYRKPQEKEGSDRTGTRSPTGISGASTVSASGISDKYAET